MKIKLIISIIIFFTIVGCKNLYNREETGKDLQFYFPTAEVIFLEGYPNAGWHYIINDTVHGRLIFVEVFSNTMHKNEFKLTRNSIYLK